jgi:hypothetical protein
MSPAETASTAKPPEPPAPRPGTIKINAMENGLHSIAQGLLALDRFEKNPNDLMDLKDAILRSHHGIETLLKQALYRVNPLFILPGRTTVDEVVGSLARFPETTQLLPIEQLETVEMARAVRRASDLRLLAGLRPDEAAAFFETIAELTRLRNGLQHYEMTLDPLDVTALIGDTIPRAIGVLDSVFDEAHRAQLRSHGMEWKGTPLEAPTMQVSQSLKSRYAEASEIAERAADRYDRLVIQARNRLQGYTAPATQLSISTELFGGPRNQPRLNLAGLVKVATTHWGTLDDAPPFPRPGAAVEDQYSAQCIHVGEPAFRSADRSSRRLVSGSLRFVADLLFRRNRGRVVLPDTGDAMEFLREIHVQLVLNLTYEAEDWNEPPDRLRLHVTAKSAGSGNLTIRAAPLGHGEVDARALVTATMSALLEGVYVGRIEVERPAGTGFDGRPLDGFGITGSMKGDLVFEGTAPARK